MASAFADKKHKILQQLSTPETDYSDLSPKGSVDEGVRNLCTEINQQEGYVTTSSCAGRIAIFLEGARKANAGSEQASDAPIASQAGKGGGRWLFVSHDPVDLAKMESEGFLTTLLGVLKGTIPSVPPRHTSPRFIHLKFEPMILHIQTASLAHAQRILQAALTAGFRESGIGSIGGTQPTPLVAVRTQGLAFDSVVAYEDSEGNIRPMVSEEYLRTVVVLANQRFVVNEDRKERFQRALLPAVEQVVDGADGKATPWEPADVRRERKRAEGLRRREETRQKEQACDQNDESENAMSNLDLSSTSDPLRQMQPL